MWWGDTEPWEAQCGFPVAKFPAVSSSLAALLCEAEGAELDFLMAGLGNMMGFQHPLAHFL